jgi:hypothetical protein
MARALLVTLAALLAGCRSVTVTPRAVREARHVPPAEIGLYLARWAEAVRLANEFLVSPRSLTMPRGAFVLTDDGMLFVTDSGTWPIEVRHRTWGAMVKLSGGQAQAWSWGFEVVPRPPDAEPLVDHSLFVDYEGEPVAAGDLARTILHETAHILYPVPWGKVGYYAECVFLLRSSTHSAERIPRAVSEEFAWFHMEREGLDEIGRQAFAMVLSEHFAEPQRNCRHGPF